MPLISIIMPVYNAEKYLKKSLGSLTAQTFQNIEIICIDDGSTDNSSNIISELASKDKRIVFLTQSNSGPARARNLGLQNAQGKYIMFCDSDDWYEPDMCQVMLNHISAADITICNANVIDEHPDTSRTDHVGYYKNKYSGIQSINHMLIRQTNVVLWNKIFKKDIIDKYGINFPNEREYDDDCFYLQYMSVIFSADFISDNLYNYLRREDSIMGKVCAKKEKSIFDRLYVAKYYYDFICRHNLKQRYNDIFLNYLLRAVKTGQHRWNKTELQNAEKICLSLFGKRLANQILPQPQTFAFLFKLQKTLNIKFRNDKTVYKKQYTLYFVGIKIFSFKINLSKPQEF